MKLPQTMRVQGRVDIDRSWRRLALLTLVLSVAVTTSGCMVVKPVVGAGAAVAGAAVKTTVKATGAVVDAAVPDGDSTQGEPDSRK